MPPQPRDASQRSHADRASGPLPASLVAELLAIIIITSQLITVAGRAGQGAMFAGLLALIVVSRTRIIRSLGAFWLLLFPLFAVLSTIWSSSPGITLSYSLQLLVTLASGLIIASAISLRPFIRTLFWAATIACVASLIVGTKGSSAQGPVLIGLLGSKNNMAACANLALLTAIAILSDRRQAAPLRLIAALSSPLPLMIIAQSHAASIIALSAVAILLFLLLWGFSRLGRQAKLFALALMVVATPPLAVALPQLSAAGEDYFMTTFQKDKTLTGRTYLWEVAKESIRQRPILGWGYKYLWMSYSPSAVGMLRSQKIKDPRTFSMHQTYLEAAADLGVVGLSLLLITFIAGSLTVLWRSLTEGGPANIFSAVFVITLIIRSFTETIFGPFFAYGTILLALFAYAMFKHMRSPGPETDTTVDERRRRGRSSGSMRRAEL